MSFDPLKTRMINVVRKKNNVIVQETETVPEVSQAPHVNLKIEFDYNSFAIRPQINRSTAVWKFRKQSS